MWILSANQIYLYNTNVFYSLPLFYSPVCSVTWWLQSLMKWLNVPRFIFLLYRSHITCVQKVTDMICLQMPTKCVNNQLKTFLLCLSYFSVFLFFKSRHSVIQPLSLFSLSNFYSIWKHTIVLLQNTIIFYDSCLCQYCKKTRSPKNITLHTFNLPLKVSGSFWPALSM